MIVVIRCGGSHSAVIFETIAEKYKDLEQAKKIYVWDDSGIIAHTILCHLSLIKSKEEMLELCRDKVAHIYVCNGNPAVRERLVEEIVVLLRYEKYEFPNAIHKLAFISPSASLGKGNYIGPNSIVNTNAVVGDFCIVNSNATVDHDCSLANYATINPGAVLCGNVQVHKGAVVGANASGKSIIKVILLLLDCPTVLLVSCIFVSFAVREKCVIANNCVVGMQSCVIRSIETPESVWLGVPAKHCLVKMQNESQPVTVSGIRWCVKKPLSYTLLNDYLGPSISSGHVTNDGPLISVLAAKLKLATSSKKEVLMAANGTAALHALVAAFTLKLDKHLVFATQAFTFPSSIQGPLQNSVVVDMDEATWGPSLSQLEAMKHTVDGIIITNCFGYQVDLVPYEKWCSENNKILLLDNAASPVGSVPDGRALVDVGQ